MISSLLAKAFGTANARKLRKIQLTVAAINSMEPSISQLTNEELTAKTNEFRQKLAQGSSLDDILPEAYAVVREVSKRELGQRHFDVQLVGGIVLHQGKIAEMRTGEGKTLTATLPLYLNALTGKGAHLVTVNDYLARRDAEWMMPIYNRLGLTVGILQNQMRDDERKNVYNCDVLYATNNELGFDYLRDNMKHRLEDYVQRELNYAIIDEVDSILIDEARTPLIISGATDKSSDLYAQTDKIVKHLERNVDYEIDEKERAVHLTEAGVDAVEKSTGVDNLYALQNLNLLHHLHQALRAHALFKRDVEYVVKDGELLIVDEFTGRILPGRRYSDGLHQALEAKEGVTIAQESQTLAAITIQNFFRMYKKLAGMTGTAATESEEFHRIYNLDVISIPTNRPMIRDDKPDLILLTKNAKYKAIVEDVKKRHQSGQPVLIGTIAIETSELLSNFLHSYGVPHEVLNAKQHEREADIVAHAGQPGHVTIATNMAGRGTDIKLTPESVSAGGLYILGTERHESRRIDNQLRGRSGRQGDPGESRFYISLEDDLIRIFAGGDAVKKNMQRVGMKEDEIIESAFISRTIERSQEKVEAHNFDIRKNLIEYDDVLNQQRKVVYAYRRSVLEGSEELMGLVSDMIAATVENFMATPLVQNSSMAEVFEQSLTFLNHLTGIDREQLLTARLNKTNAEILTSDLINFLLEQYQLYRGQNNTISDDEHTAIPADVMEKWLMLETIDQAWKQHMLNLDHLKEGIGLRGWGQKNPLIEYKKEAFDMFQEMMSAIRWDIVHHIFHLKRESFNQREIERKRDREMEQLNLVSGSVISQPETNTVTVRPEDRIGRNDPCPCNSGKKYKKCCGS